ncbi:MAG: Gfo/Idh/MocA family oxidoreductase [Planctomycetota bacterium]|nr:Gfo/Idh/MocA family oxidoreductase [Planctomycetota bacterium]
MSKPHRIAIIGVGAIAGMHARAIADIPNVKLVAGSCRGEEKGRKFAQQFNCAWYDSYEKMLDAEKPDVVTICTPSGAHLEPMLACAKRGVHVLCEKPLEITTSRVDEMVAAAKKAGIVLGGFFPTRYNPVALAIQQAAAAGRMGQLSVVNAYTPWWREDTYYAPHRWQGKLKWDGGGALMNQSIHGVDAIQWIAGSTIKGLGAGINPVEQVFAFTAKRGHDPALIEVEDTAVAVLRFRDGTLGQVLGATSMWPGSLKRLQVAGRDGTAEILEDELVTYKFREERPEDAATRAKFAAKTKTGGGAADPMAIDYSGHTRNLVSFLESLDAGQQPAIDGVEARKAVAIIEAIYESARTGKAAAPR